MLFPFEFDRQQPGFGPTTEGHPMKALISLVLFLACNNDSARVAESKGYRAQGVYASSVEVDYGQSFAGVGTEFYSVHPDFTDESFPSEPGGTQQVTLEPVKLHHDNEEWISTDEAVKRLEAQGMRPATAHELRAFAKANPEFLLTTVAPGSSWVDPLGDRKVPHISISVPPNGRGLYFLDWIGSHWLSDVRFLAVQSP